MRNKILSFLLLLAAGLALLPLENSVRAERMQLKYGGPRVSIKLREAIGQNLAIALLAGMRGVVADFMWIDGHGYWEKKQWLRQYRCIEVVATLQPQAVMFWDLGQWHMAWNIGYGVLSDPKNRTKAEGIKREHEWHEKAREFLARGIENIPNRYDLYFTMGWLYYEKLSKDCDQPPCREAFCKAAEYFHKAASFRTHPSLSCVFTRGRWRSVVKSRPLTKNGSASGSWTTRKCRRPGTLSSARFGDWKMNYKFPMTRAYFPHRYHHDGQD